MESTKNRKTEFPLVLSVRVDFGMYFELEDIAEFERMGGGGVSAFVRRVLLDEIRKYERNPQYISFKKKLGERAERERERKKLRQEKEVFA